LAAEIAAQFALFRKSGLALDHVNAHKHFHLHPTIAGLIIEIGRDFGMRAARVPTEPSQIIKRIEPATRAGSPLLAPWTALLRRRFDRAGMRTPDNVFCLAWSGAMTTKRLAGLLDHLPSGLSEIYLHPATANELTGSAPGYRYIEEFVALTAPVATETVKRNGIQLGGFADFCSIGLSS